MRKFYLLSICIIIGLFAVPVHSQVYYYNEPHLKPQYDIPLHELSFSIGLTPMSAIMDGDYEGAVSLNLSYSKVVNSKVTFGFTLAYDYISDHSYYNGHTSSYTYNFFSPMFSFKRNWHYSDNLRIYSHFAVGIWFYTFNERDSHDNYHETGFELGIFPSFQISPLGIEWGNRFVVFAEAGIGFSGYFTLGVRTRF